METKVKVDIIGANNKILKSYVVCRSTVGQTSRRFNLVNKIIEQKDLAENDKTNLLNCAALASVLQNVDGDLIYPDDDAAQKIYNEMPHDIHMLLLETYMEINNGGKSLKAKKKKF